MTVATQQERVRAALLANPFHGISQVDFLGPTTIDGSPPITRLAARIDELRNQGMTIEVAGRRKKCVVYRIADGEGGDGRPHVSSDPAPAIPLAAGMRWFCHATNACIRAGALDGQVCPRGGGHETHREHYLDLVPAVVAERLAA